MGELPTTSTVELQAVQHTLKKDTFDKSTLKIKLITVSNSRSQLCRILGENILSQTFYKGYKCTSYLDSSLLPGHGQRSKPINEHDLDAVGIRIKDSEHW
jgi:hypothetical protein